MPLTPTTRLGLVKPDGDPVTGDFVDIDPINDNMDKLDAAVGAHVCTSGTRPTGSDRWDGRFIRETDTRRIYVWNATQSAWDLVADPLGSAWTTYTPVWTADGGNPTNTAAKTGFYTQIGKTVHYSFSIVMTGTGTFGTGSWAVSVPVTAATDSWPHQVGSMWLSDASVGPSQVPGSMRFENATSLRMYGLTGILNATTPWTWAVNDQARGSITYQAA